MSKELDGMAGGGGKNYYDLPPNSTQLLDLIEFVNMNGNIKDIFKACYRLGRKPSVSREYDLRKMALYALRELGRELGRKDYLTLAEEVIGHHDLVSPRIIAKPVQWEYQIARDILIGSPYTLSHVEDDGTIVVFNPNKHHGDFTFENVDHLLTWLGEVRKQKGNGTVGWFPNLEGHEDGPH